MAYYFWGMVETHSIAVLSRLIFNQVRYLWCNIKVVTTLKSLPYVWRLEVVKTVYFRCVALINSNAPFYQKDKGVCFLRNCSIASVGSGNERLVYQQS